MSEQGFARSAFAKAALLATASAVSLLPLAAAAETVAGVDVSVGGVAASNPYLEAGDDTGALGVNASIRPFVIATEDATTVTIDGELMLEDFFDDHGTDESARVGASIVHLLNERTTVTAGVNFLSSESGARRYYRGPDLGGLEPGEFPNVDPIDPTLGNIAGRTTRLDVDASLSQAVSPNGVIDLSMGLGLTRVETAFGQDYRDSNTALSYSRRLNERTSLRFTADFGYADYFDRRFGDGMFVTTLAGVDHQLSPTMYGSLQLGLSYSDIKVLPSGRENITSWAARFNLCDTLARGTLCVNASRSAEPTSLGGITMVSAVGFNYGRTVGIDGYVSFTANYSKSGMSDSPVLLGRRKSEIAYVDGTYTHQLGERVSAYVSPSFTANEDEFTCKEENYQVVLGITYRLGSLR
jgi:hypothetical protein